MRIHTGNYSGLVIPEWLLILRNSNINVDCDPSFDKNLIKLLNILVTLLDF